MTREIDLRRAIIAEPDNDDLRLVYADWCDENGQAERAEFIRIQIQLESHDPPPAERAELEERESQLREEFTARWLDPSGEWTEENVAVEFRRGFVEEVNCYGRPGADYLLDQGGRLFGKWPITALRLIPQGGIERDVVFVWEKRREKPRVDRMALDQWFRILELPWLSRLRLLDLGPSEFGTEGELRGTVIGNRLGDEGAIALANCPLLANLEVLQLQENAIGEAGAQALAASPYLKHLTRLDLQDNDFTPSGAHALRDRYGAIVLVRGHVLEP